MSVVLRVLPAVFRAEVSLPREEGCEHEREIQREREMSFLLSLPGVAGGGVGFCIPRGKAFQCSLSVHDRSLLRNACLDSRSLTERCHMFVALEYRISILWSYFDSLSWDSKPSADVDTAVDELFVVVSHSFLVTSSSRKGWRNQSN